MIKYTLLSFQFIGLLVLQFFSDSEPVVDNQAPGVMVPGEKKEVTITIQKEEIQGFARLELVLPEGLVATAGKTEGASFTFNEQRARFVWMTLPTVNSFQVTYYLECQATSPRMSEISGTFSYIRENRRVDSTIPVRKVSVNAGVVEAPSSAPPAAPSEPLSAEASNPGQSVQPPAAQPQDSFTSPAGVTSAMSAQAEAVNPVPSSAPPSAGGELTCTRTITPLSATDFRVDIRISQNNIQGFAKILETVPQNCKTQKLQDAGAVVTQEKNSIKFVWFELPQSSDVDISYTISCLVAPAGLPVITGKLSYVENNAPKEIAVLTSSEGLPLASSEKPAPPATEAPAPTNANAPESDTAEQRPAPVTQQPEQERPSKPAVPEATSVPGPEKGISYKVQILAAHRVVNKTYFQQRHRFSGSFNIENHEGWVKYTTGRYEEYRQARDAREELTREYSTLPGPFVTAYNDGQRITVQEALLISNQQWYQ